MGFFNWGKAGKLKKIAKEFDTGDELLGLEDLLKGNQREEAAEKKLFDLVEAEPELQETIRRFGATRADLKNALDLLLSSGAGQWAGGHYVAVSALAFPDTLEFTLRHTKGKNSIPISVPASLVEYFRKGQRGKLQA